MRLSVAVPPARHETSASYLARLASLHAFAKLCNRAGLGHWHPHELRHSGASLMLAQGTLLAAIYRSEDAL